MHILCCVFHGLLKLTKMKRLVQIAAIAVLAMGLFGCAAKKEIQATYGSQHNVDAEIVSVGKDGTKMIKAWGHGKTAERE